MPPPPTSTQTPPRHNSLKDGARDLLLPVLESPAATTVSTAASSQRTMSATQPPQQHASNDDHDSDSDNDTALFAMNPDEDFALDDLLDFTTALLDPDDGLVGMVWRSWSVLLGAAAACDLLASTGLWPLPYGIVDWGTVFSLLWFVDAFVAAHQQRRRDQRRGHLETAQWKYYGTILLQLLLLPVGFYVWVYDVLHPDQPDAVLVAPPPTDELLDDDDNYYDNEYHVLTQHSQLNLLFALVHLVYGKLSSHAVRVAYRQARRYAHYYGRRLVWTMLRNPGRALRRATLALTFVRWLQYLAPLVGATNKLLANVVDLTKRWKQHREAELQARLVRQHWRHKQSTLSADELRVHAAIVIQKNFRAHRTRRQLRALRLLQGQRLEWAVHKVQSRFRESLRSARRRVQQQHLELQRLEDLRQQQLAQQKQHPQNLNDDDDDDNNPPSDELFSAADEQRMAALRAELQSKATEWINRKLLLRPNTPFAIRWKTLFVVTVLIEIGQLAWKPIVTDHLVAWWGGSSPTTWFIALPWQWTFVASRCFPPRPPRPPVWRRVFGWITRRPPSVPVLPPPPPAWFCSSPTLLSVSMGLQWLTWVSVRQLLWMVSLICFLDVFVTFFTGRLHPQTGRLEPQPWFHRWILPGLALQLAVNPKVAAASHVVGVGARLLWSQGPVRVVRWTLALVYPAGQWCGRRLQHAWLIFCHEQNQQQHAWHPPVALP